MTTSIITNLLEPICELFYKYKKAIEIEQANINTVRNYGFSTSFSLNYGFEIYQPIDLNNIQIQPGVFTYNSSYYASPDLVSALTISTQNEVYLQDLPTVGIGTINYKNKTLPVQIIINQQGTSLIGIASDYKTKGIPYDKNDYINDGVIRCFESDLVNDSNISILVFLNLEDSTFVGTQTNWRILPSSLYNWDIKSYRYNNGYGQFYSMVANNSFIGPNISIDYTIYNNLYNCTYMNVYNWLNYLTWVPDFTTWFSLNKDSVSQFLKQFLSDYFNVS